MPEPGKLRLEGRDIELPIVVGTENERAIDINRLRGYGRDHARRRLRQHRLDHQRHHVPGWRKRHPALSRLSHRSPCRALRFRRDELSADLRRAAQRASSSTHFASRSDVTRCCMRTCGRSTTAFRAMPIRWRFCRRVVGALSTFYQDSLDPHDPRQVEISIHRLMAKLPTIAAYSYKKSIGQPFIYPQNDLSLLRELSCR